MSIPSWIKMRVDLYSDLRVSRLASRWQRDIGHTRVRLCAAVGMLHRTWALFDSQTEDGLLPGVDLDWLDDQLGEPGWGQAMVDVGWLDVTPDGLSVPDFTVHNGESAKKRAQAAKRKRKSRKASRSGHAGSVTERGTESGTPSSSSSSSSCESKKDKDDPLRGASERLREGAAKAAGFVEMPDWLPPKLLELDEHFCDVRSGGSISVRAWLKLIQEAARDQAKFEADAELTYERSAQNLQDSSKTDDRTAAGSKSTLDTSWGPWPDEMPEFMQRRFEAYLEELWGKRPSLEALSAEIPRGLLQRVVFDRGRTLDSEPGSLTWCARLVDEYARAELDAWLYRVEQAATTPAKAMAILTGGMRRAG